ncbi:hypothetical protein Tco_0057649, partial [Tanacetum coccineum]
MTHQNANVKTTDYDQLFDNVIAKRAKQSARNHDPLALVAYSNVPNSQFHAKPSYSHSPQTYYVTHPSSVIDYEENYQGEIQGDAQEDKLTTAMMVDIQSKNVGNVNRNAGRQNKNLVAIAGNGMVQQMEANDHTIARALRIESNLGKPNVQCYNCNERSVIMMARIQPTDDTGATSLRFDADILSE